MFFCRARSQPSYLSIFVITIFGAAYSFKTPYLSAIRLYIPFIANFPKITICQFINLAFFTYKAL